MNPSDVLRSALFAPRVNVVDRVHEYVQPVDPDDYTLVGARWMHKDTAAHGYVEKVRCTGVLPVVLLDTVKDAHDLWLEREIRLAVEGATAEMAGWINARCTFGRLHLRPASGILWIRKPEILECDGSLLTLDPDTGRWTFHVRALFGAIP